LFVEAHISLRAIHELENSKSSFVLEVNFLAVKSEQKRKLTRQEAGRIGGEKVARERGPEFYRAIGKKGGEQLRSSVDQSFTERLAARAVKAGEIKPLERRLGEAKDLIVAAQ
jgi:uncharacterized protein